MSRPDNSEVVIHTIAGDLRIIADESVPREVVEVRHEDGTTERLPLITTTPPIQGTVRID